MVMNFDQIVDYVNFITSDSVIALVGVLAVLADGEKDSLSAMLPSVPGNGARGID